MIYEVTGDILHSRASTIVHGVAPNDHFNSGLAQQLRLLYPSMFRDFRHYCQVAHPQSGDLWTWSGVGRRGVVNIISLLTQSGGYRHGQRPGRATIENVNHALRALHKWVEHERPESLAMPRLATGFGGLDWQRVLPLIHHHLGACETAVYIYACYRKDVHAFEPSSAALGAV